MSDQLLGQWYSQRNAWQRHQGGRLLELADPRPGERVLDVGCGTGEITEVLAEAVGPTGHVTGVDLDAQRLQVARCRAPRPNLSYRLETAEAACAAQTAVWDLAFINYVIHWLPDRPRFFASLRRALRPGGRCALSTIEALPELFGEFCRLAGTPGQEILTRLHFVAAEVLAAELSAAGFSVQSSQVSAETKPFASVEQALEYWEATSAGAVRKAAIPAAELNRLAQDPRYAAAAIIESVVRIVATAPL